MPNDLRFCCGRAAAAVDQVSQRYCAAAEALTPGQQQALVRWQRSYGMTTVLSTSVSGGQGQLLKVRMTRKRYIPDNKEGNRALNPRTPIAVWQICVGR